MLTTGNNNRHANIVKRFFICQRTAPIKRKSPRRAGIFIPRTSASGALQNPGFPHKTKTIRRAGQSCHLPTYLSWATCRFGDISEWRSFKQLSSKLGTVPRVIGGCPKSLRAMQLSRLAPQRPGTARHTATVPALLPSTLKRVSFRRSPSAPRPAPARPTNGGLRPGVDQTSRSNRRSWNYFKYDLRKGQPPCFSKSPAPDCPKDTHRPLRTRRWFPKKPKGTNLLQGPIFNHDKIIAIDF